MGLGVVYDDALRVVDARTAASLCGNLSTYIGVQPKGFGVMLSYEPDQGGFGTQQPTMQSLTTRHTYMIHTCSRWIYPTFGESQIIVYNSPELPLH